MTYRYQGIEADTAEEIIALKEAMKGPEKSDDRLTEAPWTRWTGGAPPVDFNTVVEVKFRGGVEICGLAGREGWYHLGTDGDIIAYRVIK